MFYNYLIIAWRNLLRERSFSLINISGLAVGMASAVLIFLWIKNELSYDRFHLHKNQLYEVYGLTSMEGKLATISQTSQPLGPAMEKDFPEVKSACRVASVNSFLLSSADKRLTGIEGSIVDPAFLNMFSFPIATGDVYPLREAHSMVITERLGKKLFGNSNPLNQTILIDSLDRFLITAVLKDLPGNTRFNFDFLLPWSYLTRLGWNNDSWLSNNISTFVQLDPMIPVASFNEKIKDITRRYTQRNDVWTHFLFPLKQWHLYAEFENGKPSGGRIDTVKLFATIALFILLIACINFTNLSTARSEKRAKEVGLRKVVGAGQGLLMLQFICESIFTAAIAGVLAGVLVQLVLPAFSNLIDARLFVPYSSVSFWLTALGFIVFTGILAGSYPAFLLAAFKPVSIFQKRLIAPGNLVSLRKALVVGQFTFAVILIISVIVVRKQIQYSLDRPVGYSTNQLIRVDFAGDIENNYPLIKQELYNIGIAASITKTMTTITSKGSNTWGLKWRGKPANSDETIGLFSTDADLVRTTDLQLVAGRDIDVYTYPTDSLAVLLNETAVKAMGFDQPIGEIIEEPAAKLHWRVVGVVKDYVVNSPYARIPPMVIQGAKSWFTTMHIRFKDNTTMTDNLAKTAGIFKKYNPSYPFDYKFVDEEYAKQFLTEQRTLSLAGWFAFLAIFISCLGLLGLASYSTTLRTKEIGVRKIVGASVWSIIQLLSRDFIGLVFVSILIAIPIAWYGMNQWLLDFEYRVKLDIWVFLSSGLLALLIALLTVSYQSIKAAITNPIKSLKRD